MIAADPHFDIFRAGPEVKGVPPPQRNTPKSLVYEAYVDGVAVELSDAEQNTEHIAQFAKNLYSEPPDDATATQATTTATTTPEIADGIPAPETTTAHNTSDRPVLKEATDTGSFTQAQPDNGVCPTSKYSPR